MATEREMLLDAVVRVALLDAKVRSFLNQEDPKLVQQMIDAVGHDPTPATADDIVAAAEPTPRVVGDRTLTKGRCVHCGRKLEVFAKGDRPLVCLACSCDKDCDRHGWSPENSVD